MPFWDMNLAVSYEDPNHNLSLGSTAMPSNTTGIVNVAVGYQCLQALTTGSYNVAVGDYGLNAQISGSDNIAIGTSASLLATTNSFSVAIGSNALHSNNAPSVIGIGYHALYSNTTGIENVGIGYLALASNTANGFSTAVGHRALNLSTGSENTGVGDWAGVATSSGVQNTFIGASSGLVNSTGFNNALMGAYSGQYNTTGGYNAALGFGAGGSTTGSYNTALGTRAGANSPGALSYTVAIGASDTVGNSVAPAIGNACCIGGLVGAVNQLHVGIGTFSPGVGLDVHDNVPLMVQMTNEGAASASAGGFIAGYSDPGAALSAAGLRLGGVLTGGATAAGHVLAQTAGVVGFTTESWAGANRGSRLDFETVLTGGSVRAPRARIDGAGNLAILQQGLVLPNINVAGNVLDWYEEGIFTPTLTSSGGGTPVYTTQYAHFDRVGRTVHFIVNLQISGLGTLAAGTISIGGLPYPADADASFIAICPANYGPVNALINSCGAYVGSASTNVSLTKYSGGANAQLLFSDLIAATGFYVTGFYDAA
jgi:hypothetical protein